MRNMPGFTAEAALSPALGRYGSSAAPQSGSQGASPAVDWAACQRCLTLPPGPREDCAYRYCDDWRGQMRR